MTAPLWVLVANASEARLLECREPDKPLVLVKQIDHPEGRMKGRDLLTDRPGMDLRGSRKATHGYEPPHTVEQHEAEVFAKHLAGFLEKEGAQKKFERLALLAPPAFLGILRKALSKGLMQKIFQEIAKDLPSTWVTEHELKAELRELLGLPDSLRKKKT